MFGSLVGLRRHAGIAAVSLVSISLLLPTESASAAGYTATISTKGVKTTLMPGVTHTDTGFDLKGNKAKTTALLKANRRLQNVHIMGWGVDNPEPSDNQYQTQEVVARVKAVYAAGGVPVITFCCAPDWMKGGKSGSTDWDNIEGAPLPSSTAKFGELAGKITADLKQAGVPVHYYQVWNELKGYDKLTGGNTKTISWLYTNLYNSVYDQVVKIVPDAEIGGPYLPMEDALTPKNKELLTYWMNNRHTQSTGSSFVVLDTWLTNPEEIKNVKPGMDRLKYAAKFAKANKEITALAKASSGKKAMPIWWAEYYLGGDNNLNRLAALDASVLIDQALNNGGGILIWEPQTPTPPAGFPTICGITNCLFTQTGKKLPGYNEQQQFLQCFSATFPKTGTAVKAKPRTVYPVTFPKTATGLKGIASGSNVMLVNNTSKAASVTIKGKTLKVGAYGVASFDYKTGKAACGYTASKKQTTSKTTPKKSTL